MADTTTPQEVPNSPPPVPPRELNENFFPSSLEPSAPVVDQIKSVEVISWERDFYTIKVKTASFSYTVNRTASEFDALRLWVNSCPLFLPNTVSIALPPSSLMSSLSSFYTVRNQYSKFLSSLVMYPVFRDSYEVRNFLAFDEELERFYPMGFEGGVEGGIYVKLLQVRGLEGLNYCSVEMNMAKPLVKKEGGEVVKRPSPVKGKTTTNMKWNQEFVFFVKDRRAPLRMLFYNPGYLTSQLIAHAEVDLLSLTPFHVYEYWTPLESAETGSIALIQIRFSPNQIPRSLSLSLSPFRLTLEKQTYYPGECIRGMVIANNSQPRPCRSVCMRLYSYSRTDLGSSSPHKNYRLYRSIIDVNCPLYWGKKEEIDEGSYNWPFEIVLPQSLPPSVRFREVQIVYGIKVLMDNPPFKKEEISCPIYVVSPYATRKPIDSSMGRESNDSLQVRLESPLYLAGTEQRVIIHASNKSRNMIKNTSIQIYAQYTFSSNHGVESKKEVKFLTVKPIIDPEIFSSLPYERSSQTFTLPFKLPPNVLPTINRDTSPLFDVSYEMIVTCGSSSITFPFIVSQPPPKTNYPEVPPPNDLPDPTDNLSFSGFYIPHLLHEVTPLQEGVGMETMVYPSIESDAHAMRDPALFRVSLPDAHKFGQPVQPRKHWEMVSPCAPSLPCLPGSDEGEVGEKKEKEEEKEKEKEKEFEGMEEDGSSSKYCLKFEGYMTVKEMKAAWHESWFEDTFPQQ